LLWLRRRGFEQSRQRTGGESPVTLPVITRAELSVG
jgi:hypothetical protein